MKKIFRIWANTIFALMVVATSQAAINITGPGQSTSGLATSYLTLASAIYDLNNVVSSISGQITLTLTSNEIAPAGGYTITATPTGISALSNIIIDGAGNTITASAGLSIGSLTDGIFKIVGADFITIQNFVMRENTSNSNTGGTTPASLTTGNNMTEWGVALLHASQTNGTQHCFILDNDIRLDINYSNTFGIYSNARHSATNVINVNDVTNNTTGPNHANTVQNNRISNVNMGIAFIGSTTNANMDLNNVIGGSSSLTANSITDWGSNSLPTVNFRENYTTEYYGILMLNQKDNNISWNTVRSLTTMSGSVAAPLRGIHNAMTNPTTAIAGSNTAINYNTITLTDNLPNSGGTGRVDGIINTNDLGTATLTIKNNFINGLAITGSGSNHAMRGISNNGSAGNVSIDNNKISGNTSTASAMGGIFTAIEQTGAISGTIEINGNYIGQSSISSPAITYSVTPQSNSMIHGISNSNSNGTTTVNINNNSFFGFVTPNSPVNRHIYINNDHTTTTATQIHIDYNVFENIDAHTAGDVFFINFRRRR